MEVQLHALVTLALDGVLLDFEKKKKVSQLLIDQEVILTYLLITYLITLRSRVFLEKLTGFQLVKTFATLYGTQMFITAVTSALHLSLSRARLHQNISPGPRLTLRLFRSMIRFYGEELLAPIATPKQENHLLSAVRDRLFNIFAATLHIGGCSSILKLRTRHTVVKETQLSRPGGDITITCVRV